MTRELELLLLCARSSSDAACADRIATLIEDSGLDWRRTEMLAAAHGLAPFLLRHLRRCSTAVPAPVLEELTAHVMRTTVRTLDLVNELFCVLDIFEANGIRAVPYKGPALAALLYGDVSLRPCSDLDFLVESRHAWRAVDLLHARGYRSLRDDTVGGDAFEREGEFELVNAAGRVVDLHSKIVPDFFAIRADERMILDRAESVHLMGRAARILPPEVLLPLLCIHGAKHCWTRLQWMHDVALLTGRVTDWRLVLSMAERMRAGRMVLIGSALAREFFGARLPVEILRLVYENGSTATLTHLVSEWLERPGHGCAPNVWQRHRFVLGTRERVLDRLRYISRLALRPSRGDRDVIDLPERLRVLYLLVKPFRLALKLAGGFSS